MNSDQIHQVLTSLGYNLDDRGSYWQTNAVFRNGDNKTALQIYKDTGVWRDFVNNTPPLKFERLVQQSAGGDAAEIKKLLKGHTPDSLGSKQEAPRLHMEDVYPEESLKKLLPHYRFYNDRGISDKTLKILKGGLATEGQMYQRFVFPIYNEFNQVHGFSGRDMLNKENRPKWKHVGKKSQWVYPAHLRVDGRSFLEKIEEKGEVIIVESIGDLLSLHEHGHHNALVSFGLDIPPTLISSLVQINPQKIILSFNNDELTEHNRGLEAAIKNYLKLLSYFDCTKLFICLPTANDFGDMRDDSFEKWAAKLHNLKHADQSVKVLKYSQGMADRGELSKRLIKNRNILSQLCDE